MVRAKKAEIRRRELISSIAGVFAKRGYHSLTIDEIASQAGLNENELKECWHSKKEMFIDSIHYVFEHTANNWQDVLEKADHRGNLADILLEYEAEHVGQFSDFKIIFMALGELADPDIKKALQGVFSHFQEFIRAMLWPERHPESSLDADHAAWAFLGMGFMANMTNGLGLLDSQNRQGMMSSVGGSILTGLRSPCLTD